VIYELSLSHISVVTPLFKDVWIDKALIDSVIEGSHLARVFVDDVYQPKAVLMCCERGDYFVIGAPRPGPIRQFIKDMPSEADVFNRERFAYFMPEIAWEAALIEDYGGHVPIFPTRSFRYSHATMKPLDEWREALRQDAFVRRIDATLLEKIDRGIVRTVTEFSRDELNRIFQDSFGFCTITGDEIASVAWAFVLSSKYAAVSIDTAEPFRRRGFATLACVAFIEHCLAHGLTAIWNCLASNIASAATALKLGMEEGPAQRESAWRPVWKHVRTTKGLWTKEDEATSMPIGTIIWRRRNERSSSCEFA
jgi:RimJ/RimL family protein N-acetyltransferase